MPDPQPPPSSDAADAPDASANAAGPAIAVAPEGTRDFLADAVEAGGGRLVDPAEAEGLVWSDHKNPDGLRSLLDEHDQIRWVQLPWAGIEPFVAVLDHDRLWTCGKGVYAPPVAEHALMLGLAGMRGGVRYAKRDTWSEPYGRNLLGANVTILGGGEITTSLIDLLKPFGAHITVMRRHPDPMDGVEQVVGPDGLDDALTGADLVVLALALTPETTGILDARTLGLLPDHAWIINVARGAHIVTDDLVTALQEGSIGGAALDVTDPEPLPDDHPLWHLDNCLITPHTANTPEMGAPLLAARVSENVRRFAAGEDLLGPVDTHLGY